MQIDYESDEQKGVFLLSIENKKLYERASSRKIARHGVYH